MARKKIRVQAKIKPKNPQENLNPENDIDYFVNMMHEGKRLAHQKMMEDPMLFASMVSKKAHKKRKKEQCSVKAGYIDSDPITGNLVGKRVVGCAEWMVVLDGDAVEALIHIKEMTKNGR